MHERARSKLEKYLNILEVLVPQPRKFEDISYNANMECRMQKRYLSFLISHNLVEEAHLDGGISYSITARGLAVLKTLEAEKYFEKIKKVLVEGQ